MKDEKNNVSDSAIKPLQEGSLNELCDKIYKEHFFDYDETVDAKEVLDALQNLKSNPKLLDYVIKCLAKQNIATIPSKFYSVTVNAELRMPYNEQIHKTFEAYQKHCIDGDFGLKKRDYILDEVFSDIGEIEKRMMENGGVDIPMFGTTKHEKYSIHEIRA